MTLPLFDVPDAPEKRPENIRTSEFHSDVKRLVQAKSGPFIEVKDGQPTGRQFRIAELTNGNIRRFFLTGEDERSPVAVTSFLIDDAIRFGTMVEVGE